MKLRLLALICGGLFVFSGSFAQTSGNWHCPAEEEHIVAFCEDMGEPWFKSMLARADKIRNGETVMTRDESPRDVKPVGPGGCGVLYDQVEEYFVNLPNGPRKKLVAKIYGYYSGIKPANKSGGMKPTLAPSPTPAPAKGTKGKRKSSSGNQ
ncbi:MAG: hypothetical protein AAF570_10250 [Bacteroidota bacterium]